MIAIGIDLGGTKAEAQVFDDNWNCAASKRVATPQTYPALLDILSGLVNWAADAGAADRPIGIGAAGLVHPISGRVTAANLATNGQHFQRDLSHKIGKSVTVLNDSAAFAMSEAHFGAGIGVRSILSLVIGTGVSGAVMSGGVLRSGPTGTLGEFGHIAAAAHLAAEYGLPLVPCGCGRVGCIETLISGPGICRIVDAVLGRSLTAEEVVLQKGSDPDAARVWDIWLALVADLLRTLTRIADPDCVVIGGGLSKAPGLAADLKAAFHQIQFADFTAPDIRIAQGGDASGARGAAYAAWQATQ